MATMLSILWVVLGIGLMLLLNLKFKINSMVALLLAAILVGILAGMDLLELVKTIKSPGMGSATHLPLEDAPGSYVLER